MAKVLNACHGLPFHIFLFICLPPSGLKLTYSHERYGNMLCINIKAARVMFPKKQLSGNLPVRVPLLRPLSNPVELQH